MRKAVYMFVALFASLPALAQEATQAVAAAAPTGVSGLGALGLALMVGLGAFGAAMGQGRVGASAMEGIARNPQASKSMFVPMIIGLALIESLFILSWLIVAAGMIKI